MQASRARWVGVGVHVLLLGMVGHVFYGNCTVALLFKINVSNEHEYLIIVWLQ